MRKISKMTLENFRVFLGKREIDFNNSNKEPANFVCIYGKNGFGKTSLFDGFEWAFTGEIHLLKKELNKNVASYEGRILKNRDAGEDKRAGIEIEFSDGTKGCRTVFRRTDSINDYGRGRPNGVCTENLIDGKQILPHSKIDSFVYADKPTEKFEKWGDLWNIDRNQRSIFKVMHNTCRDIDKKVCNYEKELAELAKEFNELNTEQKVNDYNKLVDEFNQLTIDEIMKLEPVKFHEDEKIDSDSISSGEKLLQPLQSERTSIDVQLTQCKHVESDYNKYEKVIQNEKEFWDKKRRWKVITDKYNQRKILIEKQEKLLVKKKRMLENRNVLINLFDEEWFNYYGEISEIKSEIAFIEEKIENKKLSKQRINQTIKLLEEEKEVNVRNLKNILAGRIAWEKQIKKLEAREQAVLENNLSTQYSKLKHEADKKKNNAKKELEYLQKASGNDYIKFVENLKEEEILKYLWIKNFWKEVKEAEKLLEECKKKEKESRGQYENMQQEIDNIGSLLALATKEIKAKKTCICPVCKSQFDNTEILLKKIDLSTQQNMMLFLKDKWEKDKKDLRVMEEVYEEVCKKIEKALQSMINRVKQEIISFEEDAKKYKKEIQNISVILKDIQDEKERLRWKISECIDIEDCVISLENINTICQSKIGDLKTKIERLNQEISEKKKILEPFDMIIGTEEKSLKEKQAIENEFYSNLQNQKKIEILKEKKIFSYKNYLDSVNEYNEEIEKIEIENTELEKMLESYNIYNAQNIDKHVNLLKKFETPEEAWISVYEYDKQSVFGKKMISYKTVLLYMNRLEKEKVLVEQKMEILDRCLSNLSIQENIRNYNKIVEKKKTLQKTKKFEECKLEIAKEIFNSAQNQLEEYIKGAIGDITTNHIYEKIEPHKGFKQLKYRIEFNDNGEPELYMKVLNEEEQEILPELFFSSAQLNAVALSVFLGGALSISNPGINTIFIDDPIGHFDDLNVLSFIDVIRTIISETDWQIIISTHEESFYELMKVKLNPRYYNSKFLFFKDEGTIVEDDIL